MAKEVENIRTLCAEIVQKANTGHPGAPLGLSHFMHILYTEYLNLDPDNPRYSNRDIFILSNGHACVIQYLMGYFVGFLSMEDLQSYRQLNSHTPGHPEKNDRGIEVSTGPLGQGVAASVGFAISSKLLSKYGFTNHVYCLFGDGCYQEGISQEAFSLCSKLGLDNITFIYDFNNSTIDGPAVLSMGEDVTGRFRSLNFTVLEAFDEDAGSIRAALDAKSDRPKVIVLHTKIAKDSELEDNCKAHGSPLGEENVRKLKQKYGIPETAFYISEDLRAAYEKAKERMRDNVRLWTSTSSTRKQTCDKDKQGDTSSAEKILFESIGAVEKGQGIETTVYYPQEYRSEALATRKHFANCLNTAVSNRLLISGCADLTPSVLSQINDTRDFGPDHIDLKSYLRFGIREHAMCGVMNGIASHGVFIPVSGTFLNFITYGLASVRLACLDGLKTVYVLTHDSIGLGGDGPTHQPIEVLASLRALPKMVTLRPCDGRETRSAFAIALREKGPVALILSRQKLEDLRYTEEPNRKYCRGGQHHDEESCMVERGGYYLYEEQNAEIILIATGSEVQLAFGVKERLGNRKVSVVSMISFELFERQPDDYRDRVLRQNAFKVSIEALSTFGWSRYSDFQIGLGEFGKSAPQEDIYEFFGLTPESISKRIVHQIESRKVQIPR